jgi:hypothetical protein
MAISKGQALKSAPHTADPLVEWMRKNDIPLTRKRYLALAYPEGHPVPWTMELEEQLPAEIRKVKRRRA